MALTCHLRRGIRISKPLIVMMYSYSMFHDAVYGILSMDLHRVWLSWSVREERTIRVGDALAFAGASVGRWMDTVLCLPFSSMVNVCSLARTIWKAVAVFFISLMYVAVAILSASLVVERSAPVRGFKPVVPTRIRWFSWHHFHRFDCFDAVLRWILCQPVHSRCWHKRVVVFVKLRYLSEILFPLRGWERHRMFAVQR